MANKLSAVSFMVHYEMEHGLKSFLFEYSSFLMFYKPAFSREISSAFHALIKNLVKSHLQDVCMYVSRNKNENSEIISTKHCGVKRRFFRF